MTVMDASRDQWLARCATAACVASRWPACGSLALTTLALACLFVVPVRPLAAGVIGVAAAAGAVQAYLAARVEFDRLIFQRIAVAADAGGFDAAAQAAGLLPANKAGRDLAERIAGLLALTKKVFIVFLLQLALLIAAAWMSL
jgi:hypothetical protein